MTSISTPPRPSRLAGSGTPSRSPRSPFRPTPRKRTPLGDAETLANSMRAFQERHASEYAHLHVSQDDTESVRRLKLEAGEKRLEEERRIGREKRERMGLSQDGQMSSAGGSYAGMGLGSPMKSPSGPGQLNLRFQLPRPVAVADTEKQEDEEGDALDPAPVMGHGQGHARSKSAWRPLSLAGKRGPGHARAQSQGTVALGTQPLRPLSTRPKVARLSMAVLKTGRSVSDSPMRTPTLDVVDEQDGSPFARAFRAQASPPAPESADVSLNKSTYSWATSFSGETEELRTAATYVPRLSLDDDAVEELAGQDDTTRTTPDKTNARRKRIVAIAHTARQLEGIGSRDPEDPTFWPVLQRAWNERPGMDPQDVSGPPTPLLDNTADEQELPMPSGSKYRNTLTDSPPDLNFKTPAMQDEAYMAEQSQFYDDSYSYSHTQSNDTRSQRYSYASSLHDLGSDGHVQGERLMGERAWMRSSAHGPAARRSASSGQWGSRWSGAAGNWAAPPPLQPVEETDGSPVEEEPEPAQRPMLDSPIHLPPLPEGRQLKRVDASVHQAGLNSAGPSRWGLGIMGGWWNSDPSTPFAATATSALPPHGISDDFDAADSGAMEGDETQGDMSEVDFQTGEAGTEVYRADDYAQTYEHTDLAPLPAGPPSLQFHPHPAPLPQHQLYQPSSPMGATTGTTRALNLSGAAPGFDPRTPPSFAPAALEVPPAPKTLSRRELLEMAARAAEEQEHQYQREEPHHLSHSEQGARANASLSSSLFLRQSLIRSMDSCIDQTREDKEQQADFHTRSEGDWEDEPDAEGEDDSQWLREQAYELPPPHVAAGQAASTEVSYEAMDLSNISGLTGLTDETASDVHGLVALIAQAEAMAERQHRSPQSRSLPSTDDRSGPASPPQPPAEEAGSPMGSDGSQTSSFLLPSLSQLPLPPPRPASMQPLTTMRATSIDFSQPPAQTHFLPQSYTLPALHAPPFPALGAQRSRQGALSLSHLLNPADEPSPGEIQPSALVPTTLPTQSIPSAPLPPTPSTSQTTPSRPSSLFCYTPLARAPEPASGGTLPSEQPSGRRHSLPTLLRPQTGDLSLPSAEEWYTFPSPVEFRSLERERLEERAEAYELQRVEVTRRERPELKLPLPVHIDTVSPASTIVPASTAAAKGGARTSAGSAPASSMAWLSSPATLFWLGWVVPFIWIFGGWIYAPPARVMTTASGGRVGVEGGKVEVLDAAAGEVPERGFMRLMYHPDPWVRACRWGAVVGVPSVMAAGLAVIVCLGIIR